MTRNTEIIMIINAIKSIISGNNNDKKHDNNHVRNVSRTMIRNVIRNTVSQFKNMMINFIFPSLPLSAQVLTIARLNKIIKRLTHGLHVPHDRECLLR